MIRMNMCHDTTNPPGQVINEQANTYKPAHGGYPRMEPSHLTKDFYDYFQQISRGIIPNRTSEYDR